MVAHEHRGELVDALQAAAEFVGEAPCVLHRADGLLGELPLPFVELLREESPDVMLLVQQGAREAKRLRLVRQRLLSASEFDPTKAILGVAERGGAYRASPHGLCVVKRHRGRQRAGH